MTYRELAEYFRTFWSNRYDLGVEKIKTTQHKNISFGEHSLSKLFVYLPITKETVQFDLDCFEVQKKFAPSGQSVTCLVLEDEIRVRSANQDFYKPFSMKRHYTNIKDLNLVMHPDL